MANWDITKDDEGNEFVEMNGKRYPQESMNPNDTLNNPKAFHEEGRAVWRDCARKFFGGIRALEKIPLD